LLIDTIFAIFTLSYRRLLSQIVLKQSRQACFGGRDPTVRRTISIVLLCIVATATTLHAEQLVIRVLDRDIEIPLEGVRIVETQTGKETYTDASGEATLVFDLPGERAVIVAELIGYEDKKVLVKDFDAPLVIEMIMEGVLVGEELVIEAEAAGETDAEVGVSTVIEKEVIESSAKMGIIEDVINAVKLLPGVSYSGSFGTSLSVRGSAPDGVTAVMDGFVVKYPYHWGGAFSIFNPNIVESVKFSTGIFSAKYGQATSGILDVTTVTPNEGFKYQTIFSTSTFETFLQVPFGKQNQFGIFAGARLTNYDFTLTVLDAGADLFNDQTLKELLSGFSRAPYIYDFYFKTNYRPADKIEWYINGFWGNDGVSSAFDDIDIDFSTEVSYNFDFKYYNTDLFANTGIQFLPTDNLLIHLLGGYEYWKSDIDGFIEEFGTHFYSDAFLEEYGYLVPPGEDSFFVSTESEFESNVIKHGLQGSLDLDFTPSERVLLQAGLGTYFDITDNTGSGEFWSVEYDDDFPVYRKTGFENEAEDNKLLTSFIYANSSIFLVPDLLEMEAGVRLDHSYLMGAEGYDLNTYPVLGPRLRFTVTPPWEGPFFKKHVFSAGVGLFSKTPFEANEISENMGLEDFDVAMPKTVMTIIGWETGLAAGFRFKIEGYYKYIFDRFYTNSVLDEKTGLQEDIIHNDGIGHAAGFDLILDRRTSRYFDGLLSYSFIFARYLDPETDGIEDTSDPRGEWYYPSFHRFNTLNLLITSKPAAWVTFTTKLSFATGIPRLEYGDTEMFVGYFEEPDGTTTIAEMYSRRSYYSDTLRTNFALPLDIKVSFHNYFKDSKLEWEFYLAVEDVLSPLLYELLPEDDVDTNLWSGEDQESPSSSFSIPIPSIGFRLSL
jgi:hypothetical protein